MSNGFKPRIGMRCRYILCVLVVLQLFEFSGRAEDLDSDKFCFTCWVQLIGTWQGGISYGLVNRLPGTATVSIKDLQLPETDKLACPVDGAKYGDFSLATGPKCPRGHQIGLEKEDDVGLAQDLIMGPQTFKPIEMASTNHSVALRRLAVGELSWVWDQEPAKGSNILAKALRDKDPICRRLAIEAEFFAEVMPAGYVRTAVQDPSYIVRQGIVKAIVSKRIKVVSKADLLALLTLLDDADLKESAVRALEISTGAKVGSKKLEWSDWINSKYSEPGEKRGR